MTATATKGSDMDKVRAKAYTAAQAALRDAHPDEFSKFYEAECRKAGIAYKPRLSAEQKAAKQIEDLYAQFPNLRNQPMIDFPNQA